MSAFIIKSQKERRSEELLVPFMKTLGAVRKSVTQACHEMGISTKTIQAWNSGARPLSKKFHPQVQKFIETHQTNTITR